MADYTVSTNLISWIPAMHGIFGWPANGQEAEFVRGFKIGDYLVPKFAQHPTHLDQEGYQRAIAAVVEDDFDKRHQEYTDKVNWGAGAVPFVMRIGKQLGDQDGWPSSPTPWACVEVEVEWLSYPISTSEYLRLRVIPVELAGQFKAMAAPNKHIQLLPEGAAATIKAAGDQDERGYDLMRREVLVHATSADEASEIMTNHGLGPDALDRAFLVAPEHLAGLHVCEEAGSLKSKGEPIGMTPADLGPLLEQAKQKAVKSDGFKPARAFKGAAEIIDFLTTGEPVKEIGEFAQFHDRYVILPRKVTEAIDIAARPDKTGNGEVGGDDTEDETEGEAPEVLELDELLGLSVEAVNAELPEGMSLPHSVLSEAVTAVRSGKHLLFSGPPGTGKSTVAAALCRAVVKSRYRVATATADWTTFDTIGGYMPQPGATLSFEPGIVLRCLKVGDWLLIDELNRADIDKAFGPLFTLLASTGKVQETVVLPYKHDGKNIEIGWAETLSDATTDYAVTRVWRLLGTMNVSDKASLFQLSFAFLRRFAIIDVPLPVEPEYRSLFTSRVDDLPAPIRDQIVDAAMKIAFGPVPLGPAILLDIAAFTRRGLNKASSGVAPYDNAIDAFLTAVRLYGIPQYEGAGTAEVDQFKGLLKSVFADPPAAPWNALDAALHAVSLK